MAKFNVTPELASMLKSTRVQYHITAKDIAEHIGKSRSYMSRLENGDIKTIEEKELTAIFKFIYGNDDSDPTLLDSVLEDIYNRLDISYSDEEIKKQLWFDNYDTVMRRIPIPSELIDDISIRMRKIGLSISELSRRINANEGILPQITNKDDYPYNEWQAHVEDHKVQFYFIKISLPEQEIEDILNGVTQTTNYISLLSISYYLHKIEKFGQEVSVPGDDNDELTHVAIDYLNKYKFFSIAEKNRLASLAKSAEEFDSLISHFDRENQQLVGKIIAAYKTFSEYDIQQSNQMLSKYLSNIEWDIGFMMVLQNLEYFKMNGLSFNNKKQFLVEVRNLIEKYQKLPEQKKNIDLYDMV